MYQDQQLEISPSNVNCPMGSIQNTFYYCCVSKGGRVLYAYSGGDHEIEKLAALCLERTPPYHNWYFETMNKRIFGFLIEDGYVYFAIVNEALGNSGVLQLLEHVRDEFRRLAKKGSSRSTLNPSSQCIQEQLGPVIQQLITSLERVSQSGNDWPAGASSLHHAGLSASPASDPNGQIEVAASTKAPLLGRSSRKEKKRDHVIAMREIELEERRKSTDRGIKVDSGTVDSDSQTGAVSSTSLPKDLSLMRTRSGALNIRKKWCRQVRIVLAIDAAVCLVLFVVWLIFCGGTECMR
ncbi:phytolongin Phyl1.1 [Diospyros lotus]|uniref:phytolongin Phyl1.1 n=1 Tax=Diospyros lotus TaxID=55363 RepID=UPI00224FC1B5|nr:phytolongin Phyl1.1 [Diospyros lotus]